MKGDLAGVPQIVELWQISEFAQILCASSRIVCEFHIFSALTRMSAGVFCTMREGSYLSLQISEFAQISGTEI